MSDGSSGNSHGTSLLTLLTVLFIGLKLSGIIDWPWLWVLAPLWGQLVLLAVILIVMALWWIGTNL